QVPRQHHGPGLRRRPPAPHRCPPPRRMPLCHAPHLPRVDLGLGPLRLCLMGAPLALPLWPRRAAEPPRLRAPLAPLVPPSLFAARRALPAPCAAGGEYNGMPLVDPGRGRPARPDLRFPPHRRDAFRERVPPRPRVLPLPPGLLRLGLR